MQIIERLTHSLDYAKLTRKAGAANKAAAVGSSLRPKAPESDCGDA